MPVTLAEAAERVQAHAHDRNVHLSAPLDPVATGRNANVTTSLPSSSVRNGTTTSSISMPSASTSGSDSVSRVSTFTSPGSST